ncbi:uncharacterized protein LOC128883426 [Hylaeus volcanicus]|uniref:uncharacterized protein LOC128883426 n=1 Tax=Hylaeus volcanicus TaxID=313075 RepID=UPI0023B87488|nr:uncharacterized protein LOC128883426 [Hylaeus volcanicus]
MTKVVKKLLHFKILLKQASINTYQVFFKSDYRHKSFKGLKKDIFLNSSAGFVIYSITDLLTQVFQRHHVAQRFSTSHENELNGETMHTNIQENVCSTKEQLCTAEFFSAGMQGIILNGVLLCPFYRFLDVLFGDTYQLKNIWPSVSLKIFSIQTIYMPISLYIFLFCTPFFNHFINLTLNFITTVNQNLITSHKQNSIWNMVYTGFPNSNVPLQKARENVSNNFFWFYKASWFFWPISDAVNLRYIPVSYRPIFDSLIDCLWVATLLYFSENKHATFTYCSTKDE